MNHDTKHDAATSDALIERYRDANAALGEAPNPRVRNAVLTYAQGIADATHRTTASSLKTTAAAAVRKNSRAANDGMWRYAVAAAFVTAGLTALFTTFYRDTPDQIAVNAAKTAPTADKVKSEKPAETTAAANSSAAPSVAVQTNVNSGNAPIASADAARTASAPSAEKTESIASALPSARERAKPAIVPTQPTQSAGARTATSSDAVADALSRASPAAAPPSAQSSSVIAEASQSAALARAPSSASSTRPTDYASASGAAAATTAEPMIALNDTQKRASAGLAARSELKSAEADAALSDKAAAATASTRSAPSAAPASASAAAPRVGEMTDSMRRGMDNMRNQIAMRESVDAGDAARVRNAIRAGGDVNQTDAQGTPLLIVATRGGAIEVVSLLLANGATVDRRDAAGMTALDVARQKQNQALIDLLTRAGAR
jgi:hypothetical protein